jgi:YkoY family integral membrane protein
MDFLHNILGPDLNKAFFTILNIIFVEGLLSVDNAAVLATLVMDLPEKQRGKALRIGLIFAYIFRGSALLLACYLLQINWVKLLGGAYLLFLALKFFYEKAIKHKSIMDEAVDEVQAHIPAKKRLFGLNQFWSTVVMVEAMDLVFSLDNVLAAGAFSQNMYIVCIGVFIGIITMRIVASYFVKLMARFPFLDFAAFIVISMLGIKLVFEYFYPENHAVASEVHSGIQAYAFSLATIAIFVLPILTSLLFNFPKNNKKV